MKAIYKTLVAAVAVTPLLTGCIEETFPNNAITQDQLEGSKEAVASIVWGMPANMLELGGSYSSAHYQFGYPSTMHALDLMTDDMVISGGANYDHFTSWSSVRYSLGEDYLVCQTTWNMYYGQVLACNKAIAAIDPETTDSQLRFYLGTSLAYRAFTYMDAAMVYEVLPNKVDNGLSPDGKPILGLTIPIVTEKTTEEECRNNPRATHEDMVKFIDGDLENAILYLTDAAARPSKLLPDLGVVYGLKARLYLWDASYVAENGGDATELYKKAADYADRAIATSKATPLTKEEWLNTTRGFNDDTFDSWMFSLQYEPETDAVRTSIINWVSMVVNEQNFGYTSVGCCPTIGASFYERMSDLDFRKLSYKAPEGSPLEGKEPFIDAEFGRDNLIEYNSIKIRPGQGQFDDYKVAAAVSVPLMRVEEMYFVKAEALAHVNPSDGNEALKNFMRTYRYGTYNNDVTSEEDVVEEIIFQKRIELWGEGRNFFDVKRLNMSVVRAYAGSNFNPTTNSFVTEGRPGWMNFVITAQETENNQAILGYNTPDPSGKYSPVKF